WSAAMAFAMATPPPPGPATLLSPTGSVGTFTPTYTWSAVASSTWYYLWVDDSSGTRITQWYRAAEAGCASGTGTCSVTPMTNLVVGTARSWVRTWSQNGYGPWSAAIAFV